MTEITDVLTRARLALKIEDAPAAMPAVATGAVPTAAPLRDNAQIADVLERARAASSPGTAAPAPAPPRNVTRRVEIMMTARLGGVRLVRDTLHNLQTQLLQQLGGGNLELRVTAFLDGCRHTTPWSRSPIDAGNGTARWHCFQGQTRFAEALAYSAGEGTPIDAIVLFGNRFDDDLAQALDIAERLRDRGTRIYAFHVGLGVRSRHAYELLAERTGGAFVQLSGPRAFARVLPVIADYLLRPAAALRAPTPRDSDTRALVGRLKLLPPPAIA